MSDIREQWLHLLDHDHYVADIYKVGSFGFPPNYTYHQHKHPEIEISYIIDGSCEMIISEERVQVQQGECIITYPEVEHSFNVSSDGTCYVSQVEFRQKIPASVHEDMMFFKEVNNPSKKYIKLSQAEKVRTYIEDIAKETRKQHLNKSSRLSLDLLFLQLFMHLSRAIDETRKSQVHSNKDKYHQVLNFINNNYTDITNMEDVCEQFDVSARYIRRRFNEDLGMGSSQYINMMRISKAKEYLGSFHHTVTEVAFMTGFTNSQYFSRVFREYTSLSPTEYRQMVTKDTEPIL